MRRLVLLLSLLGGARAFAHDADMIYAQLDREGGQVVRERLTMTVNTLLWLAPIDEDGDGAVSQSELEAGAGAIAAGVWDDVPLRAAGRECTRATHSSITRETYFELRAEFRCPEGPLTQTFRLLSVLPPGYRVVLGAFGQGEPLGQSFADRRHPTLTVMDEKAEPSRSLDGWIALGVKHIFEGIDHLAFLLAVLLVGGTWKRTLLLVTSFTVAHSITLGATVLGVVTLSGGAARWVEIAIALSIVWVAVENLVLREHRHRVFLTFAFGLVHGFGFASVLAGYGLGDSVVSALLGFNLGVELGQAAVVLVLSPLVWLLSRRPVVNRWTVRVGSAVVLAAGAFWMVERALG